MPGKNKSPQWLLDLFNELVPADATKKNMFGHPAAWINGNMFLMLVDEELGLRLSEEDAAEFRNQYECGPYMPRGNCNFHGMLEVPEEVLSAKENLKTWIDKSFAFTASLPRKKKGK